MANQNKAKCKYINQNGKQCQYNALEGEDYCSRHLNYLNSEQMNILVSTYIQTFNQTEAILKANLTNSRENANKNVHRFFTPQVWEKINEELKSLSPNLPVEVGFIVERLLEIVAFNLEKVELQDKEGNSTGFTVQRNVKAALDALDKLAKYKNMYSCKEDGNYTGPKINFIRNLDGNNL